MPRQNKEQAVTNALREEGLKIIGSDKATSTEKMHWSKLLFDMQDVTKQELTVQVKQAEDAREAAETALKTSQDALDSANVKIAELEPLAAQLPDMTAQYTELKANFDARVAEMRNELVSESQSKLWAAERAQSAATEKLREAQSQFGQKGLQLLLDEVQKLVQQFSIPEPDLATLPNGISPLFLTCWGNTPIRAQLLLSFAKSFPEPSENYTRTLVRCLKAQLPVYEGTPPSDPIEHLQDKIDVLRSLGKKWPGVLEEVNRQVEEAQVQRQADFLRNHYAQMHSEEQNAALAGMGRSPIGEPEPASITGCPPGEPHLLGCVCSTCQPGLKRRSSLDVIGGEESF
jgi:hypothetical protein